MTLATEPVAMTARLESGLLLVTKWLTMAKWRALTKVAAMATALAGIAITIAIAFAPFDRAPVAPDQIGHGNAQSG